MNVDINKAGNGDGVFGTNFRGARGKREIGAWADGLDFAVANENSCAENFSFGSDGFTDVQKSSSHGQFVS
jgi:hypothetical protein